MASVTRRARPDREGSPAPRRIQDALIRLLTGGATFTELSVRHILTEAGVSRATFYAHFTDKPDLLVRLTDELRQRLLDLAQAWDPAAGEDGAERLAAYFLGVIRIHREHRAVLAALRELAGYDPNVHDFYTADLDEFEKAVHVTLTAQQSAGATPVDVDAEAASRIVVWGGEQAINRHIEVDDGTGDEACARELGSIWWHGVYRRPAATDRPAD